MNYIEIYFNMQPMNTLMKDILAKYLGEAGFESFMECKYKKSIHPV